MLELAAIFLGYLEFCLSGKCSWFRWKRLTVSVPDVVELSGDAGGGIPVFKELSVLQEEFLTWQTAEEAEGQGV